MQLEPGRKYRGTAWVNNYGEVQFRPEQKGSRPSNLHIVVEHESFAIYESKDIIKVAVKFSKKDFSVLSAMSKMQFIVSQLITYLK